MRNTQELRVVWHPPCQRQAPLTFTFWNGIRVGVDGRIIEALKALDTCLKRWDYRPKDGQTWGYNCRRITGGTGYSLHAYGIAVDINSLANPYGRSLITDMPAPMVAAVKAIRTNGGHRVWGWGGDYGGNKDAMHYEVVASPAELRTGIDWRTVAGTVTPVPTPTPAPIEEDDDMHISLAPGEEDVFHIEPTIPGHSAIGVKKVIVVLNSHGGNRVPIHIYFQSEGGPGRQEVWGGGSPWVKTLVNRPGGWMHVRNEGKAHVGGRIVEVR